MDAPKYHLTTYGCQMNKSDSERIASLLQSLGFTQTENEAEAGLILLNTCSVRQSAEDRVYGQVRAFERLKAAKPGLIIGLTGCMAGRDRDGKIRKKLPIVDLCFPIADLPQLPRWIRELRPDLIPQETLAPASYLQIDPIRTHTRQAFVVVQTGCNKFCSYCVVPFGRGQEKNRPAKEILDEVRGLVAGGAVEITLLGQSVNSYCAPDPEAFSAGNPYKDHYAALLWELNQIEGLKRLHFTAAYPTHMTDEVIDALALRAQVNFLHLAVQSGDDEVLRRMNRRYGCAEYMDIIRRVRAKHPAMAIGTDIIVGFAGETEEQFERTISLYEEIRFDISYNAIYSPRTGTAAWRAFKDDVPREEKRRRWNRLQEVMERVVREKNQAYLEKEVSVLVERCGPVVQPSAGPAGRPAMTLMCSGNSREMKLVTFPGTQELVGQIVSVRITKPETWILYGEHIA